MVDFVVVPSQLLKGRRLVFEFFRGHFEQRQVLLQVRFGIPLHGIVWGMRSRKADLQEEWLGLGKTVDPLGRHVTDKHVGMRIFR